MHVEAFDESANALKLIPNLFLIVLNFHEDIITEYFNEKGGNEIVVFANWKVVCCKKNQLLIFTIAPSSE